MKDRTPRCAAVRYRAGARRSARSGAPAPAAGADVLDALAALKAVRTGLRLAQDAFNKAEEAYEAARPSYVPINASHLGLFFVTLECFETKTRNLDWRTFPELKDCRAKLVAREKQEAAAAASSDYDRLEAEYDAALDAESKAVSCVIAAEPKCPAGALALLDFAAVDCDLGNVSRGQSRALQAAIARAAAILAAHLGIARPAHSE